MAGMASFCSRYSRVSAGRLLVAERSYEGSIPYARWHAVGGELRRAVDGVEGPPPCALGFLTARQPQDTGDCCMATQGTRWQSRCCVTCYDQTRTVPGSPACPGSKGGRSKSTPDCRVSLRRSTRDRSCVWKTRLARVCGRNWVHG